MTDPYGNPIVEWPKHYKPLPEGYYVVFADNYYNWVNDELDLEGPVHWDRYFVRRCAFAHAKKMKSLGEEQ
jgi:hypothetical protein